MVHKNLIKRVRIETIQAKVNLDLEICPECGGSLHFYLDCPFGEGNIINPEICMKRCNIACEALVYCENCNFEEFIELFPESGIPFKPKARDYEKIDLE
ncbi:MAG: hypothetical protein U9O98_06995 [Asgard group archaeon]|nr:hypothetical protein [Asgard group archaeon]